MWSLLVSQRERLEDVALHRRGPGGGAGAGCLAVPEAPLTTPLEGFQLAPVAGSFLFDGGGGRRQRSMIRLWPPQPPKRTTAPALPARTGSLRAADAAAIVMPPKSTVDDAVQAARVRRSPLLEQVEYLLGSRRATHEHATDKVVWPGCHRPAPPPVPSFADFTTTSKKVSVKSGGRGSGGSGESDSDSSHHCGSASPYRGRTQSSSSASSSSERADKKGADKKSFTSPSSATAGGAS
ncbi:unnamed protein product [Ectocarpus sp. CCAP 1310/34]|nr:unnamed protein product [Ectocarpus sp. CCAP 1310/34]